MLCIKGVQPQHLRAVWKLSYFSQFPNEKGQKEPEEGSSKTSADQNDNFDVGFLLRTCRLNIQPDFKYSQSPWLINNSHQSSTMYGFYLSLDLTLYFNEGWCTVLAHVIGRFAFIEPFIILLHSLNDQGIIFHGNSCSEGSRWILLQ